MVVTAKPTIDFNFWSEIIYTTSNTWLWTFGCIFEDLDDTLKLFY